MSKPRRRRSLSLSEEERLVRLVLNVERDLATARHARALLLRAAGWARTRVATALGATVDEVRAWEADAPRLLEAGRPTPGERSKRSVVAGVVRLFQGERIDSVAAELRVAPAELARWRDAFFAGGHEAISALLS